MSRDSNRERIKRIMIDHLNLEGMTPEMIGDDTPLWGEAGLGLDSVDALELMVALEQEYGFRIESEEIDQEMLSTVARLDDFVAGLQAAQAAGAAGDAGAEPAR